MQTAILLLGSNLGNRRKNLETALSKIEGNAGRIIRKSSVYESQPWGMVSEHSFYNQCIALSTGLNPGNLLGKILDIEREMGRTGRMQSGYEDRIIDIDILFYGDRQVELENLTIPHPRVRERKFSLIPILEIYPDFVFPGTQEKLQDILDSCEDTMEVKKLYES